MHSLRQLRFYTGPCARLLHCADIGRSGAEEGTLGLRGEASGVAEGAVVAVVEDGGVRGLRMPRREGHADGQAGTHDAVVPQDDGAGLIASADVEVDTCDA